MKGIIMKRKDYRSVVVFFDSDLPNMASHCPQKKCGYSLYKGVLVQWDEDEDERVFTFIDELRSEIRFQLLVVQEHEAMLGLLWKASIPPGYEEGAELEVEDDAWHVATSKAPETD
jgi:hypothetical protein